VIRDLVPARSATTPGVDASGGDGVRSEPVSTRLADGVALAVVGSSLALYALTFLVVRRHYAEFPPHYDSIGIYASLFEMVNQIHRSGIASVLNIAYFNGTSWLLPAYTLAIAWLPVTSPERLVSLNFVLLLAAQASIVVFGQTFGWSRLRQIVCALVPLVPGALYAWDGGIEDLRRDVQLVLLALAILFLSLAYVSQPSIWRGLALGLLVGLAQWSRDNAASVVGIVALPAIVLAIAQARSSGGFAWLVRLAAVPLVVFLLLAVPYYAATLPQTLLRYETSVWGVGESRLESLQAWWWMPASVLHGGDSRLGGRVRAALVTGTLAFAALVTMSLLWRRGAVSLRTAGLGEPGSSLLLASGAWVVVAVVLYNALLLGYGARWHGVPFLPAYVGIVALMIGLLGAVRREPGAHGRLIAWVAGVGAVLLVVSAPARMILNQPPPLGEAGVNAIRSAAFEIADRAGNRPVALLAYDTLSRHHAAYYLAQSGRPHLTEFEQVAVASGDPIDLDQPIRADDTPDTLRARLDTALRRWADFALVYTDTNRYADPRETLWPYLLGKPVVDGLLADPGWKPVAYFTLRERDLVLLEKVSR
jgi:hypothetical protein